MIYNFSYRCSCSLSIWASRIEYDNKRLSTSLIQGTHREMKKKDLLPFSVLIGPAAIFMIVMTAFPIIQAINMSTQDFVIGFKGMFIGLDNYMNMLKDPVFYNGLGVTFLLYVISLVPQLIIGLYIANLLHKQLTGAKSLRTIILTPFTMPPVAVGMMWLILLDPSFGPLNYLLEVVGLPKSLFLASRTIVVPTLAMIDTWQYTPFVVLILLGGLQAIPKEPYEAAEIDGASKRRQFFSITLPLLKSSIFTAAILRSVDLLRFFDTIYITTQGGPSNASNTLNVYAYNKGFVYFQMGYASALMITLMIIILIILFLFTLLRKRSMRSS